MNLSPTASKVSYTIGHGHSIYSARVVAPEFASGLDLPEVVGYWVMESVGPATVGARRLAYVPGESVVNTF